jgi:hypothetical protein
MTQPADGHHPMKVVPAARQAGFMLFQILDEATIED